MRKARAATDAARGKLRVASWSAPRIIQHDEKGELSDHRGAPIGTVQIEERVASGKDKSKCDEPFRPLLLRLVVLFLDDDHPARLAEDKKLPTDRPCASTCELAGVFAHGKSALAFTRCGVQGFEGPGTKYTPTPEPSHTASTNPFPRGEFFRSTAERAELAEFLGLAKK